MKYIFFSYENYSAPIAWKLKEEGNQVEFVQIEDKADTLIESEQTPGADKEEPELKKRRLSIYNGLLKKIPASKAIKVMSKLTNKDDTFIMTDINNSFKYTSEAFKMGFNVGFFPFESDRDLEVNREKS